MFKLCIVAAVLAVASAHSIAYTSGVVGLNTYASSAYVAPAVTTYTAPIVRTIAAAPAVVRTTSYVAPTIVRAAPIVAPATTFLRSAPVVTGYSAYDNYVYGAAPIYGAAYKTYPYLK